MIGTQRIILTKDTLIEALQEYLQDRMTGDFRVTDFINEYDATEMVCRVTLQFPPKPPAVL